MGRRARRRLREQAERTEEARAGVQVLAEGEDAVVAFLKARGESDFGISCTLDAAAEGGAVGRWPGGTWIDVASDDEVMATVSYDGEVFRVEAGPAAEYFDDEHEAD